jgi:hypothetical protein
MVPLDPVSFKFAFYVRRSQSRFVVQLVAYHQVSQCWLETSRTHAHACSHSARLIITLAWDQRN